MTADYEMSERDLELYRKDAEAGLPLVLTSMMPRAIGSTVKCGPQIFKIVRRMTRQELDITHPGCLYPRLFAYEMVTD